MALPDLYNSGLTGTGSDLGRRSSATGRASTLAMFGTHLADAQAYDASRFFDWLRIDRNWQVKNNALWCDSLVLPNSGDVKSQIPRDDDSLLPRGPDPLPGILGWQMGHQAKAVYTRGSIASYRPVLDQQVVLLPHDSLPLPAEYRQYLSRPPHFSHTERVVAPNMAVYRQDQVVDGLNREVATKDKEEHDLQSAAAWIVKQLGIPQK